jgi:hypothetical protein
MTTGLEIWNSIVNTAAAVGTVGATVAAVYFGVFEKRPKVRALVGDRVSMVQGRPDIPPEHGIFISITNVGQIDCVVQLISWEQGRRKEKTLCVQTFNGIAGEKLPKRLIPGDQFGAFLEYRQTGIVEWLAKEFVNEPQTLRLVVHLATGQNVKVKPDPSLLELIKDRKAAIASEGNPTDV